MRSTSETAPLIGRAGELRRLRELLGESEEHGSRTALVAGEAGIGKTRLVSEFVRDLPPEALVLRGQCVDLGADAPPYAPLSAALRSLVDALGADALRDAAGPAIASLSVLLPELGETAPAATDQSGAAGRLYDSVAITLEAVASDSPLVIVIEDIHWADHATLALLRFLVRIVEHGRILFVLTYRSDDVRREHPLRGWLPELNRSARVARFDLVRLTRPQVRELARFKLGADPDPRGVAFLFERSDGIPFLVEELVDVEGWETSDCLPTSLRDVLLARYDGLAERTQRVVRLLAAGGARVEHELLAAVFDGDPQQIDEAAREAVLANVLVVGESAYEFRHALVRDAIHDELLPGERVRFHSLYALALESGRSGEARRSSEISYHWIAAHDTRAAFSASLNAMADARASFAFAAAAQMGERAVELWEQVPDAAELASRSRGDLLAATASALRNAGEGDRAIALVEEAISEIPPHDTSRLARLLRDKASYFANVGRTGSVELLREALVLLEPEPPSVLRANVLGELSARLMLAARPDEAIEVADRAFAEAEKVDSKPRMSVARNIRGISLISRGEIERGLSDLEAAGELARGDDSARLRYWVNVSDAMNLLGRFEDAVRMAQDGVDRARRRGVERTSGALLMSNTIEPLFALGEWARADELLDRALALEPPIGFSVHLQRLKLWSMLWSGDPEGAARALRGWRVPLSLHVRIDAQAQLALARVAGEIALENGDPVEAWREVRAILAPDHRSLPAYDLPLLTVVARTIAALRRRGADSELSFDAVVSTDRLRAVLARLSAWPTAAPFAALVDAELAVGDVDLWREAVERSAAPTAPAHLAPYSTLRLAEVLAASGDRAAALEQVERARGRAQEIGAGLIVSHSTTLRNRLRASPGLDTTGVGALTERECQVLDLVAQGLSNRQIAAQLFISAKTASVHVSSILRKLGAATRTEAVFLAHTEAQ